MTNESAVSHGKTDAIGKSLIFLVNKPVRPLGLRCDLDIDIANEPRCVRGV